MTKIVIADYGLGNLFNLERALESIGVQCSFAEKPAEIASAERLILPGVGAFEAGINNLKERSLVESVKDFASSGRPVLGICLGMQLLMTESEENGSWKGLNLLAGRVRLLKPESDGCKVPNIGWNKLELVDCPARNSLLKNVPDAAEMYFVHSYGVDPADKTAQAASTSYGKDRFCSVISAGNVHGCQFHPERSAAFGLKILENFATI